MITFLVSSIPLVLAVIALIGAVFSLKQQKKHEDHEKNKGHVVAIITTGFLTLYIWNIGLWPLLVIILCIFIVLEFILIYVTSDALLAH